MEKKVESYYAQNEHIKYYVGEYEIFMNHLKEAIQVASNNPSRKIRKDKDCSSFNK